MPYDKISLVHSRIIIGMKQTLRAMVKKEVSEVYIASDADAELINQVVELAKELEIPYEHVDSKKKLGKACGIEVGTSTVALKHE